MSITTFQSQRRIADTLSVSRNTVAKAALEHPVSNEILDSISGPELHKKLFPEQALVPILITPDFVYIHKELLKSGVTLKLLWEEYVDICRSSGEMKIICLLGTTKRYRKVDMFFEIQSSINSLYYDQRITPVFIVDEVHMASTAILDDLRMLFNFKIDSANPEECRDYLSNRMKIAGCSREVFTPEAALAIFNISGGTSRVINNIATAALMYSAAKRADSVDEETVFQANIELGA